MELVKRLISEIQKGEKRYEENTSGPGFVRSDDTAHYCRDDSCRNVKASKPCSVRCSTLMRVCVGLRFGNPTYEATCKHFGICSQVLPSRIRPLFFLLNPPHCLKKNGTLDATH